MTNFRGVGIGLSLVFGFLLLALVAELYYLLWWKKRIVNTESEDEDAKNIFSLLRRCRRRVSSGRDDPDENCQEQEEMELGSGKDLLLKAFGGEESIESELMRVHNLAGPPRFLFTIKEETREDLETESVKSRTRSLSGTSFLSPLASPIKASPSVVGSFNNPLFETWASPPPRFKFLRDAEEKLQRRLREESFVTVSVPQKCSSQVLPLPSSPKQPIVH